MLVEHVNSNVTGLPIFLSRKVVLGDEAGTCSSMHMHDDIEILIGHTGILDIHFENDSMGDMDIYPGDVIIINRRVPHATNYKIPKSGAILLQFRTEKLHSDKFENINKYLALTLSSGEKDYYYFKKDEPCAKEITDIIHKMFKENSEREKHYEMSLRGYMDILLCTLYRNNILNDIVTNYDEESVRKVWGAIEHIGNNYSEEIKIEELASFLGFNSDYFCRIFKKATGVTAIEYTNYIRIFKAEKLLTTTNESILNVALSVGFSSVPYFNKVFKKYRGITPSHYRKIIYDKNEPNNS